MTLMTFIRTAIRHMRIPVACAAAALFATSALAQTTPGQNVHFRFAPNNKSLPNDHTKVAFFLLIGREAPSPSTKAKIIHLANLRSASGIIGTASISFEATEESGGIARAIIEITPNSSNLKEIVSFEMGTNVSCDPITNGKLRCYTTGRHLVNFHGLYSGRFLTSHITKLSGSANDFTFHVYDYQMTNTRFEELLLTVKFKSAIGLGNASYQSILDYSAAGAQCNNSIPTINYMILTPEAYKNNTLYHYSHTSENTSSMGPCNFNLEPHATVGPIVNTYK